VKPLARRRPSILFVGVPRPPFGGGRPFFELASEFERLGWRADAVALADQVRGDASRTRKARANHLRDLIVASRGTYDVVDFDHEYLPFARSELPPATLLVARSILLCHQVVSRTFPRPWSARRFAGMAVRGRGRRSNAAEMLDFASRSVGEADLVNVCNDDDAALLIQSGLDPDKIIVFPFGMSRERAEEFAAMSPGRPHGPIVAFVGTFDWRKGAADMPEIAEHVVREAPATRFRLLGTKGMFATARDVLRRFPERLRPHIEVVPTFRPGDLPRLLEDCSLGFFPSYLEGFGFGVLEMLAASLPVVAYDAPGPPMMLDPAFLISPGDREAMARRILVLLQDAACLGQARAAAHRRAQDFSWEEIAQRTAMLYADRLAEIRSADQPGRTI
jgi:glycosyltransferase involved in cell wall biosynthesis